MKLLVIVLFLLLGCSSDENSHLPTNEVMLTLHIKRYEKDSVLPTVKVMRSEMAANLKNFDLELTPKRFINESHGTDHIGTQIYELTISREKWLQLIKSIAPPDSN